MMDCRDMNMCFTASKSFKHLLFKGWHITSVGDMIGSMFAAFMFAVIYEGLKAGVEYHYNKPPSNCDQKDKEEHASLVSDEHKIAIRQMGLFGCKQHIIKTTIYVLNIVYAYILMLVAMSYNVWLFLALVLGLGFGYFFSQPLFQSCVVPTKTKHFKSYGATGRSSKTI